MTTTYKLIAANSIRITIYQLPHKKYESAILTKPNLIIKSVGSSQVNNIEIITIELTKCSISSVYKPPAHPYKFINPQSTPIPLVQILASKHPLILEEV